MKMIDFWSPLLVQLLSLDLSSQSFYSHNAIDCDEIIGTFSAYSLEFSDAKIPQGLKWVKHKHAQSNIHECFSEKNSTLLTSSLFDSHCYSG